MTSAALSHLFVMVADLGRSRAFYTDLGLEVLVEDDGYLRVGGGGGFHMGMEQGREDQVGGRGIQVQVRVDDVDAVFDRLTAAGVPFRAAPEDMPWGARHAFLDDPDGYPVSIFSPLD